MFYFHKVEYVQYLGEVDIFHAWVKEFLPLYNSAKITRNSSGDERANVNFLCDDIVHAVKIQ